MEHPRGMYVSVCMYVCMYVIESACLRARGIEIEEKVKEEQTGSSSLSYAQSMELSSCSCLYWCRPSITCRVPVLIREVGSSLDGSSITCLPSCTAPPTLCTLCHPEPYSYICRKRRYHFIHNIVPIFLVKIEREVMITTTTLFLNIFCFFVPAEICLSDALLSAIA